MVDYLKLFSEMLEEEDGAKKVAAYLDEIADAANKALDEQKKKQSRSEGIAEIARAINKYFGDCAVFTRGSYTPADAAEAVAMALLDMDKVLEENKDLADWLFGEK